MINNKPFWNDVTKVGVELSLIGESEARKSGNGKSSNVSDEDVEKVCCVDWMPDFSSVLTSSPFSFCRHERE